VKVLVEETPKQVKTVSQAVYEALALVVNSLAAIVEIRQI